MYCKYTDGSLIQLVKARYSRTDPQELTTYHVPLTDINGAIPLGLNWQTWTISGVIADPMSVRWRDIIWLSLDNVSWRACRVQATAFPTNMYQQSLYELTMLVSPILEGAVVRYPTTGYKWGNQSITGISQAGNVNAYPIIHYLAPLFYAPLSNTLIDFTGQAVTFTRTAPKTHNGIVYPINTPIYDNGLYLAGDTAQDVATWTPPASTVRTVAMQIKQTRPTTLPTLITNGQFETDTAGWEGVNATLSHETGAPLVGTGSLKMVLTGNGGLAYAATTTIVGHQYLAFCLAKSTAAAGRLTHMSISTGGSTTSNPGVDVSTTAVVSLTFTATATTAYPVIELVGGLAGESLLADFVFCHDLTAEFGGDTLTVWTSAKNSLTVNFALNGLLWQDDVTTVYVPFPMYLWLAGVVLDVVVIEDTSHAVTIAVHPAGYSWTSATGTLAALTWPQLTLGNLEGSIANLVQYPYVLTSAEYQALAYSSLSLLYNTLYVGNRYAGEIVKGSDKRLLNALGSDISALLGGVDISIGSAAVTITQSQGQSARWYVEVKRTDV